tara:strand:- start:9871 stop:10149 length:279 start_codon:yes stop_codon:yes gene_type:complete
MIQGTYGVSLELALNTDLTGATAAQVIIESPANVRTEGVAAITDVANGVITYTTKDGDFMHDGKYSVQGVVDFGATKKLKTKIAILTVGKSL